MDCRFIRRYLGFRPVYQLVRRLHRRLQLRDCRFIRRCLFFSFSCSVLTLEKYTIFSIWHMIFLHPRPRNVYKDMLNNMVSPNDHVVMNHQNQTRTNGIWGHVRYYLPLFGDLWQHNQSKHKFAQIDRIRTTYTCLDAYHHPNSPYIKLPPFLI
jgi:hypothetical protein